MRMLSAVMLSFLVACGGGRASSTSSSTLATSEQGSSSDASLARGLARIRSAQCDAALREDFLPLIAQRERDAGSAAIRSTRIPGPAGTLEALLPVAGTEAHGRASIAVDSDYPDMIYLAAFCAVELEDLELAERLLRRALEIIPDDPAYLCELGHIAQTRRAFTDALDIFTRADASAVALEARSAYLSAPLVIIGHDLPWWHRRALRGVGFSLIELGRLDEAERVYHRVLEIEPRDEQAHTELRVIEQMRAEGRGRSL